MFLGLLHARQMASPHPRSAVRRRMPWSPSRPGSPSTSPRRLAPGSLRHVLYRLARSDWNGRLPIGW